MSDDDKTLEEIEAETAAINAKLAALRAKKAGKTAPPVQTRRAAPEIKRGSARDGDRLREIQADQTVKNGFGGYHGRTLINKIEEKLDARLKAMQQIKSQDPEYATAQAFVANKGRAEGLAMALAVLRDCPQAPVTVKTELARGYERISEA